MGHRPLPSWAKAGASVLYQPVTKPGRPWFRGVMQTDPWPLSNGYWITHLHQMEPAYGEHVGVPGRTRVTGAWVDALRPAPADGEVSK